MTRTTLKGGDSSASADPDVGPLSFIDLFSGCGGFSLGLGWAGMACRAAVLYREAGIEQQHAPVGPGQQ